MTAGEYERFIAQHVLSMFGARGIRVYQQVPLGRRRWGGRRIIDVLVLDRERGRAVALECKRQNVEGTAEEKLEFALADAAVAPVRSYIVYGGCGFSEPCRAILAAAPMAIFCDEGHTRELDVALACEFWFWDVVVSGCREVLEVPQGG